MMIYKIESPKALASFDSLMNVKSRLIVVDRLQIISMNVRIQSMMPSLLMPLNPITAVLISLADNPHPAYRKAI
ncbi:hypothetical protein WG66_000904 [Moniliophthora roreri]|nr:hypothetical protein WG66_000904 [Moniliophthora roreri]